MRRLVWEAIETQWVSSRFVIIEGTYLSVLDFIFVHVLGTGSILADVLVLSQLIDEDLGTIPSVGLGETVGGGGLLNGQRKLTERGMSLLGVEGLSECSQV